MFGTGVPEHFSFFPAQYKFAAASSQYFETTKNPKLGESYTIYVKGGNVYQASANYIESTYKFNSPREVASEEYAQKKKEEAMAAATQAGANPYQAKPIYKESSIKFISVPNKILYNVGEPFEIAGFEVVNMTVDGSSTNVVADIELKVGSTKIYDGYKFQNEGEKTVDCYYKGEKLNNFKISVISEDSNLLADGKYTISIYGNCLHMVGTALSDWMELQDMQPAQVFIVKLIKVDKEKRPLYSIMTEDGRYVRQDSSRDGAQLREFLPMAY